VIVAYASLSCCFFVKRQKITGRIDLNSVAKIGGVMDMVSRHNANCLRGNGNLKKRLIIRVRQSGG
jgi:hypothetical protein